MGMGSSRAEARQIVNHSHITVNGVKADIPSYLVKPGDVIAVKESSKKLPLFKSIMEGENTKNLPSWLTFDASTLHGTVIGLCPREEVDLNVQEQLIVEWYSKS
jgi:small subunit ribosomal protein S4